MIVAEEGSQLLTWEKDARKYASFSRWNSREPNFGFPTTVTNVASLVLLASDQSLRVRH